MRIFDGMHPTRAQVVPYFPPLISTKFSVALRTSLYAESPAVPAPIMATSTFNSLAMRPSVYVGRKLTDLLLAKIRSGSTNRKQGRAQTRRCV